MMYAVVYLDHENVDETGVCDDCGLEIFDNIIEARLAVERWASTSSSMGVYAVCVVDEDVGTRKIFTRIDYITETKISKEKRDG
jgi:hypothetical protein